MSEGWEHVLITDGNMSVRRFKVPGGWLYQVERRGTKNDGYTAARLWCEPVFVPEDVDARAGQSG